MRDLFFIVGSVRSGTTLLRLLLGHHPQVCTCEEMEYVARYYAEHKDNIDLKHYQRYLELDRGFRMLNYAIDPTLDFRGLVASFLEQRRAADGNRLVGATVHNSFDVLPTLFPHAKFIHLVRDPRDVARSCVQMGWVGNSWRGAEFWMLADQQWDSVCAQVPDTHRLEVRFEDLVADSHKQLTSICSFLGIAYAPEMLCIEQDTTYARPDPARAQSWEAASTPYQARQVETRIGKDRLAERGYSPSSHPPVPTGALSRAWLKANDLYHRIAFRIRRYGVLLWLAGVIARRAPQSRLSETIQLKTDAIDNLHMK